MLSGGSMSWGKLLDLLSFSVFSIFSLWIGIVFLQESSGQYSLCPMLLASACSALGLTSR